MDLKQRGNVTDDDLRHVEGLTTVEWLGLATCRGVSDDGLAHLKALPLRRIDLFDTRVTPAGVASLLAAHPGIVIQQ